MASDFFCFSRAFPSEWVLDNVFSLFVLSYNSWNWEDLTYLFVDEWGRKQQSFSSQRESLYIGLVGIAQEHFTHYEECASITWRTAPPLPLLNNLVIQYTKRNWKIRYLDKSDRLSKHMWLGLTFRAVDECVLAFLLCIYFSTPWLFKWKGLHWGLKIV